MTDIVRVTIRWPGKFGENTIYRHGTIWVDRPDMKVFDFGSDTLTAHKVEYRWMAAKVAIVTWRKA